MRVNFYILSYMDHWFSRKDVLYCSEMMQLFVIVLACSDQTVNGALLILLNYSQLHSSYFTFLSYFQKKPKLPLKVCKYLKNRSACFSLQF